MVDVGAVRRELGRDSISRVTEDVEHDRRLFEQRREAFCPAEAEHTQKICSARTRFPISLCSNPWCGMAGAGQPEGELAGALTGSDDS
jgi:hypothetical protein